MMTFLRSAGLVVGILIVLGTALSVFTALVVPRITSSRTMRTIARVLGGTARHILPRLPSYELRDRLMSFVGPAAMVALFVAWLGFLIVGFGLITWWTTGQSFPSALAIAGSSVFTLGVATAPEAGAKSVEILAAGVGFLVIALEIAYLPSLYNAFATRETEVTLLATRSGTPAWGPEILARHFMLDNINELPDLYADWERWAAAVSESHTNYPALMWFRSPVASRSWLLSLVSMMDSAALYSAVSPDETPRQARLCLSMGTNCLRSMARALQIPYDPDPLPTAGIRLRQDEFADGYRRLEEVQFPMERGFEDAWRHFQGWRINYEAIVDVLTKIIVPPPAPWFIERPEMGVVEWPGVRNRTPDKPEGDQLFGSNRTFKTPSVRESKSS
ncbi:MAG TPA: hypothetical protein VG298_12510 [Acidimicrobiales bacterium]|jgi:hypothetical protein|nr:hypothetical protein [Acidimicrobiales bacterium]